MGPQLKWISCSQQSHRSCWTCNDGRGRLKLSSLVYAFFIALFFSTTLVGSVPSSQRYYNSDYNSRVSNSHHNIRHDRHRLRDGGASTFLPVNSATCDQVFLHFQRKGFNVTQTESNTPDSHHDSHISNATLVISPSNDMFCPRMSKLLGPSDKGCCNRNWEDLFEHTWTQWIGPSFHKRYEGMQERLRNGIRTFDEYKKKDRHLKCKLDQVANQVDELLPLEEEALNSLYSLSKVDWTKMVHDATSADCRLKVVQAFHCPACSRRLNYPPCMGLCNNLLHGCLQSLHTTLSTPWKRAVSSVGTAIRLLSTTDKGKCEDEDHKELTEFLGELKSFKDPMEWFDTTCENLQDYDCYDGEAIGEYMKNHTTWKSQSNPEFPYPPQHISFDLLTSTVEVLHNITKRLERYYPKVGGESNRTPKVDHSFEDFEDRSGFIGDYGSGYYYDEYYSEYYYEPDGYGNRDRHYTSLESDDEDFSSSYSGDGSGHFPTDIFPDENDNVFVASRPYDPYDQSSPSPTSSNSDLGFHDGGFSGGKSRPSTPPSVDKTGAASHPAPSSNSLQFIFLVITLTMFPLQIYPW